MIWARSVRGGDCRAGCNGSSTGSRREGWPFWVFGAVGTLQISYGLYSYFLSGYESGAAWSPESLQLPAGVILLYIAGVELQPRGRPRRVWWLRLAGFPLLVLVLAWILYGMLVL